MSALSPNPFATVVAGGLDDDAERDALVKRCLGELERAGCVVSVPSLCNRLWLGWGVDGYANEAASALIDSVEGVVHNEPVLGADAEPGRELPGPQPAVALGAIARIDLGAVLSYAEVVYKEGAHRALDAGWVPKWLAGAPALSDTETPPPPGYAPERSVVLRERLVVDFGCFGASFAPSGRQWANLLRRRRHVDAFGHLIVHARYEGDADADDLGFWARWVVAHHPRALEVAGVVGDAGAIGRGAARLAEALGACTEVRTFGPYLLHARHYERLATAEPDPDRYDRVARGLSHPYRREQHGWASMSERLRSETNGEMASTAWRDHVVAASVRTLELLADEAPTGDWNGVHLRLDDSWQGGGLWRTEVLGAARPIALDPAVALGLGWAEYSGEQVRVGLLPIAVAPGAPWGGEATDGLDAADLMDAEELMDAGLLDADLATELLDDARDGEVRATQLVWTLHVTGADITRARLRLARQATPFLRASLAAAGQDRLLVVFDHDGVEEFVQWSSLRAPDEHLSFEWPLDLRAGTTVEVAWSVGGLVVRAHSHLLAEPVYIDDVEFTHEFNEQVALAALGHRTATQTLTLERLVRAVVRRHGEVFEDGRRCLTVREIVDGCFGPRGEVAPEYERVVLEKAVTQAVLGMARAGRAELSGALVLVDEPTNSENTVDQELLRRFVDSTAQRLRRAASRAWIAPGVVNLRLRRPSSSKREAWTAVRGTEGLPDTELRPNQTWRKGHLRGGGLAPGVARTLERAQAAVGGLGGGASAQEKLVQAANDPYGQRGASERATPI